MAQRLKSLRRIEAVQRQMVKLSELRIAMAEQTQRELDADTSRLHTYISDENALSLDLAKAAMKSMAMIEHRRAGIAREIDLHKTRRDSLRRREKVATAMVDKAAVVQSRADEDRDLAQTIESWLLTGDASLP